MISLTRLNHQQLILNCDLIKSIEQLHDTVVTLVNGEKLTVEEGPGEILKRIHSYRLSTGAPPAIPIVVREEGDGTHGPQ
ncbi:MAG: flagellar FlbD family protein [Terriglobales bacterium]